MTRFELLRSDKDRAYPSKARANHIGSIGSLFGMYGDNIIDRRVGRNHDGVGGYDEPVTGFDTGLRAALHRAGMGSREDAAAVSFDRAAESAQILQGMKL